MGLYELPRDERIRLDRLSYVTYKHRDIEPVCRWAKDFGLFECGRSGPRVYFRGYGTEPFAMCVEKAEDGAEADTFGGATWAVTSVEELERARRVLEPHVKVSEVYDMAEKLGAPSGGKGLTFWDPVNNFAPMHLVAGQQMAEPINIKFQEMKMNYPTEKNRGGNKAQRFEKGPAPVHKLGHFGLCVTDFARCYDFYTTFFNLHASDLIYNEKGEDKTVFFRLDKGDEMVDHHSFFFFEGPVGHVHHSSFETYDFDVQVLGHDWLRDKGWKPLWGVGRHIMGSQIFDYWYDPSGFIMEHYVDGDLFNMSEPTHRIEASPKNLAVWGPEVPPEFLG